MNLIKIETLTLFVFVIMALNLPLASEPSEWSESKRKKGVQVLVRPFPGSNIDEFLGRTEIEGNLAQVIAILNDPASCKTLYHECKELLILSGSDKKAVLYLRNGAPWPVNDRDAIVERIFEQNEKSLNVSMKLKRTESVSKPSPSGVTRMDAFEGVWRLIPLTNGKIKIEYQAHFEPGGSVPQSVINLVLTDTPYETLINLRKLVEEGKHNEAKFDWIKEKAKEE